MSKRLQALAVVPPKERTVLNGDVREVRAFRGLTPEVAIGYLEHLGGERQGDRTVVGERWTAELETGIAPVGPSYRLTEVTITWTGDPDALDPVITGFRLKAFRAPG
ncbi:MAG: hypothetical protein R3324_18095 [Halobacteriales archaeon]|nr:hypothetical protein [Halobacteriales archaeon]